MASSHFVSTVQASFLKQPFSKGGSRQSSCSRSNILKQSSGGSARFNKKNRSFGKLAIVSKYFSERHAVEQNGEDLQLEGSTNILRRSLLMSCAAAGMISPLFTQDAHSLVQLPQRLHNRYILVRHGESTLDVKGQIQSNPGMKYNFEWALTDRGREQMHAAAKYIEDDLDITPGWIFTSNFQRAYQSAMILREDCSLLFADVRTEFSGLLDPRKMGALENQDMSLMQKVWSDDAESGGTSIPPPVASSLEPTASTESCVNMYRRAIECFSRLEGSFFAEDILIVSHGDTLSLFCAALYGTDIGRHHEDWAFDLGEARLVDLTSPPKNNEYKPFDIRGTPGVSSETKKLVLSDIPSSNII